jgi:hypothetical protein
MKIDDQIIDVNGFLHELNSLARRRTEITEKDLEHAVETGVQEYNRRQSSSVH